MVDDQSAASGDETGEPPEGPAGGASTTASEPASGATAQRPRLTLSQRLLTALPSLDRSAKPTATAGKAGKDNGPQTAARNAAVKPDEVIPAAETSDEDGAESPAAARSSAGSRTSSTGRVRLLDALSGNRQAGTRAEKPDLTAQLSNEDLKYAIKRISDRERLYALFEGGLGILVGIGLTVAAFHFNPPLHAKNHATAGVIFGFGGARVVLALLTIFAAMTRRRSFVAFSLLFLGTSMSNLLFALPFWVLAAVLIWRAFRYQKALTARGAAPQRGRNARDARATSKVSDPKTAARSGASDARERLSSRKEARDIKRGRVSVPAGPPASKRYTPRKPTRPRPPASS